MRDSLQNQGQSRARERMLFGHCHATVPVSRIARKAWGDGRGPSVTLSSAGCPPSLRCSSATSSPVSVHGAYPRLFGRLARAWTVSSARATAISAIFRS
jgi:hypothetical protein